jgi:hypothetical protein
MFRGNCGVRADKEETPEVSHTLLSNYTVKSRIEINQSKSKHITFTLRNQTSPTVQVGSVDLPQKHEVKYLGIHLDRRLTWAKHIKTKRKQLNLEAKQKENSST